MKKRDVPSVEEVISGLRGHSLWLVEELEGGASGELTSKIRFVFLDSESDFELQVWSDVSKVELACRFAKMRGTTVLETINWLKRIQEV